MKLMRSLKYFTYSIIFIICLIFIWISANLYYYLDHDSAHTINLASPYGPVTISLDKHSVPKISSDSSDLAVFYGLGYIHAKHRLWQMELQRHTVKGSLSEMFGKATIDYDKYLRTWQFHQAATNDWHAFDNRTKDIIKSYTSGVNAYIQEGKLPFELILLHYKPKYWTNIDSFAWQKMLAWQLQNAWQTKLNNYLINKISGQKMVFDLETPYPKSSPITLTQKDMRISHLVSAPNEYFSNENIHSNNSVFNLALSTFKLSQIMKQHLNIKNIPGKGSNNWVISGKYTKSGLPLLANDIHLELTAPSMWYLAALNGPQLHVTGATIPGVFTVIIGHNDHIAWGVTDAGLDVQDIYVVNNPKLLHTKKEVIKVRWSKNQTIDVLLSPDGPVISNIAHSSTPINAALSIRWPALDGHDTTAQSFLKISYAKNWNQFTDALRDYVAPSQNFVYADTENNIGYYLPGLIPIRHSQNLRFPVNYSKKYRWQGYIPFNKLPHIYNPPEGFIATANNKAVPDNYPYKLTQIWKGRPYRVTRIRDLIQSKRLLSIHDMESFQTDTKSILWNDLKPFLLKTKPLDQLSKKTLHQLMNWDGHLTYNSISATIYAAWFNELIKLQPDLPLTYSNYPNPLFIIHELKTNGSYCRKKTAKNCDQYLSISLHSAIKNIQKLLGNDLERWQWHNIHSATFKNLMFGQIKYLGNIWNRSIPTVGGPYTINVGTFNSELKQVAGATFRQIIDLSDLSSSEFVYPLGQSGNPFNQHYDDLLSIWKNGKYVTVKR